MKKRESPSKDIHYKRNKPEDSARSWTQRPDQTDILGTSINSVALFPLSLTDPIPSPPIGMNLTTLYDAQNPVFPEHPREVPRKSPPANLLSPRKSSKSQNQWTDVECMLFEEGLAVYGKPNWKLIAEHIKTKKAVQVKSYSKKYFKKFGEDYIAPISPERLEELKKSLPFKGQRKKRTGAREEETGNQEIVIQLNKTEVDEDAEIDIDDEDEEMSYTATNEEDEESVSLSAGEAEYYSDSLDSVYPNQPMDNKPTDINSLLRSLGFEGQKWLEEVEIPPTRNYEMDEDQILDFEIQANSEFFEGNNVKTPERYLRIRNYILRQWNSNRSKYVTKTSVRRGLKDCGDVNAIGRVHQFLELVGAINFGLEAPASCRKQGQPEPVSVLMTSINNNNKKSSFGKKEAYKSSEVVNKVKK